MFVRTRPRAIAIAGFSRPCKTRLATADSILSRSFGSTFDRLEFHAAMPAAIVARDVDHELQVRELHAERSRGRPQAGSIVGVVVDLVKDGV